jgi:hypothetical protein
MQEDALPDDAGLAASLAASCVPLPEFAPNKTEHIKFYSEQDSKAYNNSWRSARLLGRLHGPAFTTVT